jgi:hypothetical protein
MKRDKVRVCAEVCEALVATNVQPTVRLVYAEWRDRYGVAPSFTDILPPFRKWMTKRRNSRRVKALVRAYTRLDPVERDAVQSILSQLNRKEATDAHDAGTR